MSEYVVRFPSGRTGRVVAADAEAAAWMAGQVYGFGNPVPLAWVSRLV